MFSKWDFNFKGGNQGWNQSGPGNYNPSPSQSYQSNPNQGSNSWGNDNFGCNYQQGFGGGPMRSNYNNQRSNPYSNSNNCAPSNYSFGWFNTLASDQSI